MKKVAVSKLPGYSQISNRDDSFLLRSISMVVHSNTRALELNRYLILLKVVNHDETNTDPSR